ncbi:hypothetical protein GCM10020254_20850 [Streptomyces goshikiensis]
MHDVVDVDEPGDGAGGQLADQETGPGPVLDQPGRVGLVLPGGGGREQPRAVQVPALVRVRGELGAVGEPEGAQPDPLAFREVADI